MNDEQKTAASTLRWILANAPALDGERATLLGLADQLVGYPRPNQSSQPAAGSANAGKGAGPVSFGPNIKVALVVGHNKDGNQGAALKYGDIRESEFVFNGKVANALMKRGVPGVEFRKFNRIYRGKNQYSKEVAEVYRKVNAWDPHFSVELHFNGYNGKSAYTCMLVAQTASDESVVLAKIFQETFVNTLNTTDKGVVRRTRGERGGKSLYGARGPIVLTEPFFGDVPSHCAKVSKLGHEGIAEIYAKAIAQGRKVVAA